MKDYKDKLKDLIKSSTQFAEKIKDILPDLMNQLPQDKRAECEAELEKARKKYDELKAKLK